MANVNVTYEEMQTQASKLNAARQSIEDQLAQLKNEVASLVAGGFVTDAASGQFAQSFDEFNQGASQTIQGLDGMANYLNKAAQAFQNVDSELARSLS